MLTARINERNKNCSRHAFARLGPTVKILSGSDSIVERRQGPGKPHFAQRLRRNLRPRNKYRKAPTQNPAEIRLAGKSCLPTRERC